MEVEEIQSQSRKRWRIGNGRDEGKIEEDDDDGECGIGEGDGEKGGDKGRQSSRIFRVSRNSGGKDRHSKVLTAKGLRDRRVRLSVSTAIQFYDLQDRLGYDQPSKAVEWLINAAADSIAELPSLDGAFPPTAKQASDEKRFEPEIGKQHQMQQQQQQQLLSLTKSACSSTPETSKGSVLSLSRSEIRVKARERARERAAKEKEKEKDYHIMGGVMEEPSFLLDRKLSGPPMLPKPLAVQSEDSIQAFYGKGHRATIHEREKQPMRIKQMCPVHPETDPPDDGYRWRRFAQEEIRGATLPMTYYQCSEPGCVAKKRVHRSLEDFSIVDIVYRGVHTCNLGKQEQQQQHQETLQNIQTEPKVSHDVQIPGPESYILPESFGVSTPKNPITLPSDLDEHFIDAENEEASVISFDDRKLSGSPMLPKPSAMFLKESSSARDIPHELHRISVLDLSHTKIEFLPESISNLKNLQELLFRHCERLKMVPSLAKLIELRVLDLSHTIIKELPQGMDNLVNLRRLDLSYTRNLQLYPVGVLQKLHLLEDLLMFESRYSWPLNLSDVLGGADIKEIISATHLVNLAIRFVDLPSFVGYVRSRHWQILKSFRFDIGWASNCLPLASFRWKYSVQILDFDLVDEKDSLILPDNTLELVIKNCHGISCLSEMQHVLHLRNLKECSVVDCDGMECILMVEKNTWPTVEELILYNLPNLMTLYRGVPSFGTLASLKSVTVEHCHSLKSLFASELLLHIQNLEYVRLWMCDQIEEIIAEDEGMANSDPSNTIALPRLKELRLGFLRVLRSISKRVVLCDSVVTIVVQNCPKLKKLPLSIGDVPPSLEKIKGSRKWWDALEWDDLDIKTPLQNSFIHQSDLESESELGSESEEEDQDEEEEEEEEERGG